MAVMLDLPWGGQTFVPATTVDIGTIEAAIVAQLQKAVGNVVEVTHFPAKPEAYEMRHRVGAVMVIYLGSEYSNVIDIGNIAQERTLEFEVGLRIRDLGWAFGGPPSGTSPGAYQVLEAIRGTLTGFQPNTGCTRMRPLRERFVERDRQGGVWVYAITFQTHTLAVENYPAPNFPLFVRGTAQEEGGQTTVAVTAAVYSFVTDSISFNVGNVSAVLVQSADRSQTYTLGTDYAADRVNGIVTRLLSGAIAPGATVAISYAYGDVVTASASGGSAPLWPQN